MTVVQYDRARREHVIVLTLDPEEAENVADGLGYRDGAYRELYEAAEECRRANGQSTVPEVREAD